jgi:predicted nucleotidyltransferase
MGKIQAGEIEQEIEQFLADLDRAWPGGYTAVLIGSAARGQYLPGWSDINMLLILPEITPEALRAARQPLQRWRERAEALPLLFDADEWHRSNDAYPLEIVEMQTGYKVLRGHDPVGGMHVRPAYLRTALERELRGKLMRLRQGYALFAPGSEKLTGFLLNSASSVLLLCRGLLVLSGEPVPADPTAIVAAAGRVAGFPPDAVARVIARRGDRSWRCTEEEVGGYLAAVQTAARFVDHFQIGART